MNSAITAKEHHPADAGGTFRSRVTMQDVARVAGVHQTTVSLALRNDPRLPASTRVRIQTIASQTGYRPDPMLAALSCYRAGRRGGKPSAAMGFLLNFRGSEEMKASHSHRLFLEGARLQAERMGYRLDVFYIGHQAKNTGERLERILKARGITGLILAAFGDKMVRFLMKWDDFSVVRIESQQFDRTLHMVSSHQMEIAREAIRSLCQLGYRRIGLAVGEREETYLRNAFTAGFQIEVSQHPDVIGAPPLLLQAGASPTTIASPLSKWAKAHQLEVIASNWAEVPEALRLEGWRVPEELVVASLDLDPCRGVNAGMRQNHRIVGERAVEQLAILLRTNQRGPGCPPNSTLIGGDWVDGGDVPSRRAPFISKNKNDPSRL